MPVTLEEFIARARKRVDMSLRDWVLGDVATASLDIPLHPPAEREVIGNLDAATRWVDSWRRAEADLPITVDWVTRAWARVGQQTVPQRARLAGPDDLAALVGEDERWQRWRARRQRLHARLGVAIDPAVRPHLREIGELDEADFVRMVAAVEWLVEHPNSGLRLRELPIRGLDTKWLEGHRAAVEALTRAVTGLDGLGLNERTTAGRIRLLDASVTVGGLRDIEAPISDLAALPLAPATVLFVENLQTFLSMPDSPGVVAAYGEGNSVTNLVAFPWLAAARILYWGDLNSHGFRILGRARAAGLTLESVLMDSDTLHQHRDLWVDEPKPFTGIPTCLTEEEEATLVELRSAGHVRLEQERIPWAYALGKLRTAGLDL